jgi:primosomal protein N' (replication factor Y)
MFVEIAVNVPGIRGSFHYHLPTELSAIEPGHLVTVQFGHRRTQGIVLGLLASTDIPETKPVLSLVDPLPVLSPPQIQLARWIARQTKAPLIDCLTLMLPPGLSRKADTLFSLRSSEPEVDQPVQQRLIQLLTSRGPMRGRQIARSLPRSDWRRALDALVRRGIVDTAPVLEAPAVRGRRVRSVRLADAVEPDEVVDTRLGNPARPAFSRRKYILDVLARQAAPMALPDLRQQTGATPPDLHRLESQGLIVFQEAEAVRDPLEDVDYVPTEPPQLTQDQVLVWEPIRTAIHDEGPSGRFPFLLHGVTGSGKTEIYLRAVAETLRIGKRAIVLVPEIALTPQTVRRFLARFGDQVGLMHSRLSPGERYDTWRRCRSGELKVIVGARSALLAPLPAVGLIVVDEEHDDSYKHDQAPRHNARETALAYAEILGAVCILGSATPDIVSAYRAEKGKLTRLNLPQRILGHRIRLHEQATRLGVQPAYRSAEGEAEAIDLPPVRVVDMRQELKAGNRSLFSRALQQALRETVHAGEQAILFLNRRGTSTYVFCRDCGYVATCPKCDMPLTHHGTAQSLLCHHCGYRRRAFEVCPECKGTRIRHFGAGTQRIQAETEQLLSGVRTLRWDWDTTRTRGAHGIILGDFAAHRADILIGTQMIAKGLDFPLVTLVGVVSADTGINLPDYRASERTFQVLTQVAGRAGRGLLGGRVILQTYQPDHYAIRAAATHDFAAFYATEIRHRRELGYPPFVRLGRLVYSHSSADCAQAEAQRMGKELRSTSVDGIPPDLIGPVPCFFQRVRGEFRWQIVIRAKDPQAYVPDAMPQGWVVDIDPVSLL